LERRAPATVASTHAPTTPISATRNRSRRPRRRRSQRATSANAPLTTTFDRGVTPTARWADPPARGWQPPRRRRRRQRGRGGRRRRALPPGGGGRGGAGSPLSTRPSKRALRTAASRGRPEKVAWHERG